MPLENAPVGSPGFKRNIETEVAAGKPQKQAVAIAYEKSGERKDASLESDGTAGVNCITNSVLVPYLDKLSEIADSCAGAGLRLDELNESPLKGKHLHAHTTVHAGKPVAGKLHFK